MRRIFIALMCVFLCNSAIAADKKPASATAGPKYSIFSTSTDWQALTGLRYNEYRVTVKPDSRLIGRQGLILYYLDGFPCYGLGFAVRLWLGPNGKNDGSRLQIACVYPPTEIKLTWRNAGQDATQDVATGLMTCPVHADDRTLTIDLSKCDVQTGWSQYQ